MRERFLTLVRRFRHTTYALGEASNALTLIFVAVMARMLDTGTFGVAISVMATGSILAEMAEFGFPVLLNRSVAQNPARAWSDTRSALKGQLLLLPVFLAAVYGYLLFARTAPHLMLPAFILGSSMFLRSLKAALRGACRGQKMFGLEATFLWTERLSILVVGSGLLMAGWDLWAAAISFFIVRLVDFTAFLIMVRKVTKASGSERGGLRASTALPFLIGTLMWSLYYQINTTMVSLLSTPHDTGIFGAVYRFLDVFQVLPRVMVVVAFPALVIAWGANREQFQFLLRRLRKRLTLVAAPLVLAGIFGAEIALRLAFGEKYVEGADALRFILVGIFFSCQSIVMANALMAAGHEKRVAASLGGTVLISIALNWLLIPRYGYTGAAFATTVTELLYAITLYIQAHKLRLFKSDHRLSPMDISALRSLS